MPDWRKVVREHMGNLRLPPETREEVIAELASHFEECEDNAPHERPDTGELDVHAVKWRRLARAIHSAKREEAIMNRRIKSLWLPSLANLAAAVALMLLFDHLNFEEPGIATFSHVAKAFRLPWLLALPMLGALGALLAKHARGSFAQRLIAGLAPSFVWLVVMVTVGLFLILDPRHFAGVSLSDFVFSTLGLVVLSALALLLGTLPFLGDPQREVQE